MSKGNGMTKVEIARQDYMTKTGLCPNCNLLLDSHPTCESCFCLCGKGHKQLLITFRGHKICGACKVNWQRFERRIKRKWLWEQFIKPSPSMVGGDLL